MSVTHAKVSAIADDGVSTHVGTNEWNAAHSGFYGISTVEVNIDSSILLKDFDSRTVGPGSSWGNAQVGGEWVMTALGGNSRGVSGGIATFLADAANTVSHRNGVLQFDIRTSKIPTGSNVHQISANLRGQFVSSPTNAWTAGLFAQAQVSSSNVITWQFSYLTGPSAPSTVNTGLSTTKSRVAWSVNTWHTVKFKVIENELFVKIWRSSDAEPLDWDKTIDIKTGDWNLGAGYAPLLDVGVHAGFRLVAGDGAGFGNFDVMNISLRYVRPLSAGTFDITGLSGLTAGDDVCVFQVPGPYTDGGTLADEAEMDSISATGYAVDASTIRVYWESDYPVSGNYKFGYFSPTATGVTHAYPSPVADGGSPTLVGPDEWDAAHVGGPTFGRFEGNLGGGLIGQDFGTRVSASGWGDAVVGGTWAFGDGASVAGGEGVSTATGSVNGTLNVANVNPSIQFDVKSSTMPATTATVQVYPRSSLSGSFLHAQVSISSSGALSIGFDYSDGVIGFSPSLVSVPRETWTINTYFTVKLAVMGTVMYAKIWQSSRQEPVDWDVVQDLDKILIAGIDVNDLLVGARVSFGWTMPGTSSVWTIRNLSIVDSRPSTEGTFDVTGLSGLTAGKPVYVFQRAAPYSDFGAREDEAETGIVRATGYVVDATTIRVYWRSRTPVSGRLKFAYVVGG